MSTTDAPRPELPGVHSLTGLRTPPRLRGVARWPMFFVLLTLVLLAASIVLAITSGHLDLSPPSACNASCYR